MPVTRPIAGALEATYYDDFRDRALHGRAELIHALPVEWDSVWVELGAGTGRTIDFLGGVIDRLACVCLVDLNRQLLRLAERRCRRHSNARILEADPTRTGLPGRFADVVIFSYSLTTITEWSKAIDEARRLLSPG